MANYKNGDKLKCNFYFVGVLERTHIFSFQETKGILTVIHNKCIYLINTNDPAAINQNIPVINNFSITGSILDLQQSQLLYLITLF